MKYSELLAALLGLIIRDRVATGCADNGDKTDMDEPCGTCDHNMRAVPDDEVPNAELSGGPLFCPSARTQG